MIKIWNNYVKIDSLNSSLIIMKKGRFAENIYYGKKLNDSEDYSFLDTHGNQGYFNNMDDMVNIPVMLSSTGDLSNKESFVEFFGKNDIFINRFEYLGAEIVSDVSSPFVLPRKMGETVKLSFKDIISGVMVYQYFTCYNDSNMISAHSEIINLSDEKIKLKRLFSVELSFFGKEAEITTFDGSWLRERTEHNVILKSGVFTNDSKLGSSSCMHNPFIMVKADDGIIATNILYSGNHKEVVEVSPFGQIKILAGINDYGSSFIINSGKKIVMPEVIFAKEYSRENVTNTFHNFILNHIVNPKFAYADRPVLINNWEGTFFDFDGDKIYSIASKAKQAGIEMMVLDDGWFGRRNDDTSSLGDWKDNTVKTGGLKNLSRRIKSLGMKFGLWVEPEMISPDSDIYRKHPEYAMQIPGVEPIERRSQLMIDLVNPDVLNYVANSIISVLKEAEVDYVKWDHNRSMSDVYSSSLDNMGEYYYRYYMAQVSLLKRVTEALPDVLFESCSSGGCRYDLGMMYFMPQNWASDNTNAYDRLFIQQGTLVCYPQSSMGAHVAKPHSSPFVDLESRFNVASIGAFGYEFDITKATDEDMDIIKNQVEFYKRYRHTLQYGRYYCLGDLVNDDYGGWIVVGENKDIAVATIIDKRTTKPFDYLRYGFKGLDDNSLYKVSMRSQSGAKPFDSFTAYGDVLTSGKIDFGHIHFDKTDDGMYRDILDSRMIVFEKINKK